VPALAAGRALTGLAAGTWVPLIVVFSSFYPPKDAVFAVSLLTFFASLGRMLSTAANGLLVHLGGCSLAFYFAAGAALLAIFLISGTPIGRRTPGKPSLKTLFELLIRRDVLFPTLISAVVMFATWAVIFSFLPLLAEEIGAGDVVKGLLISFNIAAVTIGNLLNTLIARKIDQRNKLFFSVMLFGIGIAVAALASTVGFLFTAIFLMGLGNGLTYPTLLGMSIRHVAQNRRTTAMGIHQSVYAVGMFTGPWLGGMLADVAGIRVMFLICAAGCVGAAYILIFFSLNMRRIS
jgi:MFS family permease